MLYATSLAQWWTFLEQRGEANGWSVVGVPAVAGFLSWLRNGRTVEHAIAAPVESPSAETLEARLAALISFYRWQHAVHDVPVAERLLRGAPRRRPARGLLAHLDAREAPKPSSLVRVRRSSRRQDRPPVLLPTQIQAILDGCAIADTTAGDWVGNLRDRLLLSLLAETGCRLGEVLGMWVSDFVMGRGETPYVEVVPREDNPNGARVKMMRPRRVYVGADLERLFADYLTLLACRATELGLPLSVDSSLLVNLSRPPLLAPLREGTVRDKVNALRRKLSEREPMAHYGCSPTLITHPWLREAVKWCLGTMLEAGTLRWTTVSQERLRCLHRFDRWLQVAFDNPLDVLGDPAAAAGQAAAFRRWDADPANRSDHTKQRRIVAKVAARQLNDDVRAVGELFEFMAANSGEARRVLGSLAEPWVRVTATHAASWFRQVSRIPHERLLNDEHYVDDQALGQITAALPLLGLSKDRQMPIIRSDGETVTATGMNDPQAMRMILLQILTARRSSEIRLCDFDCLSAPLIAPSRPPRARRSPVPATPKAKSTSHPTPSSSTPKSWRSSKNSSAGSANGSPMSGRRSCSSSCWATGPASSPTHRGPTTGGCASSAIWCGSPTARDASSNSAIPTGSGTPS
ncbi:hypothetical protein [Saccharopolyspora hattusasensis]|uniref:hypothetical protein n=1 Tax=Saccharopolyspora hattusasensis TaxID=1128679 RepID=UPI003D97C709